MFAVTPAFSLEDDGVGISGGIPQACEPSSCGPTP